MFDPTAFDNMKVVIEGALYDLDISGEIVITDRNDFINMAKMSRQFDISFCLPDRSVIAKIEMEAMLKNLSAELLPSPSSDKLAGCNLRLKYFLDHEEEIDYKNLKEILLNVWGTSRKVSLTSQYNPIEIKKFLSTTLTVDFGRLVTEDQMGDLVEMIEFMLTTLEQLNG
jgi:hypothetical protein